ncbi:MAG: hypothetical protein WD397_07230 [Wenzhouxiangellaceae bacterium]
MIFTGFMLIGFPVPQADASPGDDRINSRAAEGSDITRDLAADRRNDLADRNDRDRGSLLAAQNSAC